MCRSRIFSVTLVTLEPFSRLQVNLKMRHEIFPELKSAITDFTHETFLGMNLLVRQQIFIGPKGLFTNITGGIDLMQCDIVVTQIVLKMYFSDTHFC